MGRLPRAVALLVLLLAAPAGAASPLEAYLQLSQRLGQEPAAGREALERRVALAREALLVHAARTSSVVASAERRPDYEGAGTRHVVRLAARAGRATVEAVHGPGPGQQPWERAEEIPLEAYLGLLRRLLDAPAVLEDPAPQTFDPNAPGPRRAVLVLLVIGGEERRLQALYGEPYERLEEVVSWVLEFARAAPGVGAGR